VKVNNELNAFYAETPVVTIGVFDGVHRGHDCILSRLVEKARIVNGESVVVTLWPHPRLVLKKDADQLRLLNTLEEKKMLLEKRQIDHLVVLPFDEHISSMSACDFIEKILVGQIGVAHLLIGHDHHFGKGREGGFQDLKSCSRQYHFEVERLGAEKESGTKISSTIIRNALLDGHIQEANEYLGYHYFLKGHVTGGHRIGQKIGFPTANMEVTDAYKLIPRDGVYAIRTELNGKRYNGMLNIGYRPTIDSHGHKKSIEAHLFDFDQNIYDHHLMIHFIGRIRDEKKFANVDELVGQLRKDKSQAQKILAQPSRG